MGIASRAGHRAVGLRTVAAAAGAVRRCPERSRRELSPAQRRENDGFGGFRQREAQPSCSSGRRGTASQARACQHGGAHEVSNQRRKTPGSTATKPMRAAHPLVATSPASSPPCRVRPAGANLTGRRQCDCGAVFLSWSTRERNSPRSGEVFALLYPTARPIVGASPSSGRLTTDRGSRFFA